jgi:hypothetical protein
MTSTSTHTGPAAGRTLKSEARDAGSQVLRAASRQLLATAGNQVLKAAVNRAVGKVDQVAGRLDSVAAGEGRTPPPVAGRRHVERPEHGRTQRIVERVPAKLGPAFSLVVHQAMRLLQLIQRLAQQLIAALARLVRRGGGTGDGEESEPGADRPHPAPRTAPKPPANKERAGGHGTNDAHSGAREARAPQAARRSRPRPAGQATSRPRPVAADRPARSGSED